MAKLSFIQTSFGLQRVPVVDTLNGPNNPFNGKLPVPVTPDPALYMGVLGTPVYCNLEIKSGSWQDNSGRTINFGGITIDGVLVTVDKVKKVISTDIQGRDGTVKEYIGDGDYTLEINGIITGDNGVRPVEDINTLFNIVNAKAPITVNSNFLTPLNIFNIVITKATFPQREGSYSYQLFSISALSDAPIQLKTIR